MGGGGRVPKLRRRPPREAASCSSLLFFDFSKKLPGPYGTPLCPTSLPHCNESIFFAINHHARGPYLQSATAMV